MKPEIKTIIGGAILFLFGSFIIPLLFILPLVLGKSDEVQFQVPGMREIAVEKPGRYYLWNDYVLFCNCGPGESDLEPRRLAPGQRCRAPPRRARFPGARAVCESGCNALKPGKLRAFRHPAAERECILDTSEPPA